MNRLEKNESWVSTRIVTKLIAEDIFNVRSIRNNSGPNKYNKKASDSFTYNIFISSPSLELKLNLYKRHREGESENFPKFRYLGKDS